MMSKPTSEMTSQSLAFRCQMCGAGIQVPVVRMPWAHRRNEQSSAGLCGACVPQAGLTVESAEGRITGQTVHRGWKFVRPVGCEDFIRVPAAPRPETPTTAATQPDRRKLVLIVDDDQDVLEGVGCRLAGAINGAEAIRMIGRQRYDLVLLDVAMPDYNGLTVLDRLRNQDSRLGKQTPVIVMTGEPDGEKRELAEQLRISAFLSKPFPVDELLDHARHELSRAV